MQRLSRKILLENYLSSIAPLVMLGMLRSAVAAGISAKYVLCNSWFSAPVTIQKIAAEKLHVITIWNAIVMRRYMMLALDKRLEEDSRSFRRKRSCCY